MQTVDLIIIVFIALFLMTFSYRVGRSFGLVEGYNVCYSIFVTYVKNRATVLKTAELNGEDVSKLTEAEIEDRIKKIIVLDNTK